MDSNSQRVLTLRDVTVIYRRRQKVIYYTVASIVLIAVVFCIFSTRRFQATSLIQIQSKSQDGLGLQSLIGGSSEGGSDALDALAASMDIQTQASILESDTLALRVIQDLQLEGTEDFRPHWNPIDSVMGLISPSGIPDPKNATLENSPLRRRRVLRVFSKNLLVKPVAGTRLIEISYLNPDPNLSAKVVNALTLSLIDYSYQTRFDATNQASIWLNKQLSDLRQQSRQLEKQVADSESKAGIYGLGSTDSQNRIQSYSGVLDQLQQDTTALTQAEQNRILREAIYHAAENSNAEMLSGLAGNSMSGTTMNNSLALIQSLRSQEAALQASLHEAEAKYGDQYPKLSELRSGIAGLDHSIQQEIDRIRQRAESDFEVAKRTESETRVAYDNAKSQAETLNNRTIDLAILRQESEESRKLYQEMLDKFKEAGILQGLKGSTVTVVDPGRAPGKPKKPNVPLYLTAALGAGFFLGSCIALVIETLDRKINTVGELEQLVGIEIAGVLPRLKLHRDESDVGELQTLESIVNHDSLFTESLRSIRTSLLTGDTDNQSQVILVTSAISGEGKTVVSSNLAVLLAQADKRVLLIDTNLREGSLHKALGVPANSGLSELLATGQNPRISSLGRVSSLDILQAGKVPSNPSELLASETFARWMTTWKRTYQFILLDTTSILPGSDALTLLALCDSALFVTRYGFSESSQVSTAYRALIRRSTRSPGVLFNGLPPTEEDYQSYFGTATTSSKQEMKNA